MEKVGNPNVLVNLISRRVRQLNAGSGALSRPLVADTGSLGAADIAQARELLGALLDVGTGTGRMLELFAPKARSAIGMASSTNRAGARNERSMGVRSVQGTL